MAARSAGRLIRVVGCTIGPIAAGAPLDVAACARRMSNGAGDDSAGRKRRQRIPPTIAMAAIAGPLVTVTAMAVPIAAMVAMPVAPVVAPVRTMVVILNFRHIQRRLGHLR